MAEALSNETSLDNPKEKSDNPECAVCLQPCVHPAQLPCGHIFCYLCVKGFANQNKKCAMCRQEIPSDFIEQPKLLQAPLLLESTHGFDGGYQWFYEGRDGWWRYDERANEDIEQAYKLELPNFELIICGNLYVIDFVNKYQYPKAYPGKKRSIRRDKVRKSLFKFATNLNKQPMRNVRETKPKKMEGKVELLLLYAVIELNVLVYLKIQGWWQYDERTSKEIEVSYKNGEKSCELLIAGFLYIVDLENMLQLRRSDPSRRRKIKRDYATIPKKGIAGLRTNEENNYNLESFEEVRSFGLIDGRTDNIIPRTPSNTPHSSASGRTSPDPVEDLATTVERISSLRLDSPPSLEDDENTFSDTIIGDHYCRHRSID